MPARVEPEVEVLHEAEGLRVTAISHDDGTATYYLAIEDTIRARCSRYSVHSLTAPRTHPTLGCPVSAVDVMRAVAERHQPPRRLP